MFHKHMNPLSSTLSSFLLRVMRSSVSVVVLLGAPPDLSVVGVGTGVGIGAGVRTGVSLVGEAAGMGVVGLGVFRGPNEASNIFGTV